MYLTLQIKRKQYKSETKKDHPEGKNKITM